MHSFRGLGWVSAIAAGWLVSACVGGVDYRPPTPPPFGRDAGVTDAGAPDAGSLPDAGVADAGSRADPDGGWAELSVGEWNLEFFGKADAGPDDAVQVPNVLAVMGNANLDLWALEEVCNEADFAQLVDDLRTRFGEGYGVVLPDDPNAVRNPNPSFGGPWRQRTALLYRQDEATFLGAQLVYRPDIDSDWSYAFPAGRDPLEAHLALHTPSGSEEIWVIVVHLKAGDTASDYARRQEASADLEAYLQQAHPSDPVMIVGDWNDDLDQSICPSCGSPEGASPFSDFLSAPTDFRFPTLPLSETGATTVIRYAHSVIDHHLISNELFESFQGEVGLVNVAMIPGYNTGNTSDHYPTWVRYHLR